MNSKFGLEDVVGSACGLLDLGRDDLLSELVGLAGVNDVNVVGVEEFTDSA